MPDMLTETLLEMRYFQPMVDAFASKYGANTFQLLKPSPQDECWLGFDQGWLKTTLTTREIQDSIRSAISSSSAKVAHLFLGFFLQFKKVEQMKNRTEYIPVNYQTPYYRSKIDTKPNKRSGICQHETLVRLHGIQNAKVSYVCPMMLLPFDIYKPACLDDLRIVPISTAPKSIRPRQFHQIVFSVPSDRKPMWCSEPTEGVAMSFDEWLESTDSPQPVGGEQIINQMSQIRSEVLTFWSKHPPELPLEESASQGLRELRDEQGRRELQAGEPGLDWRNPIPNSYTILHLEIPQRCTG